MFFFFLVCRCLDSEKWFLLSSSSRTCQRLTPSLTHKYANAFITIQASFYSPSRACVLLESRPRPHSAEPFGCSNTPLWSRASEGDDNTKVLHTGGWVCILWVSEQQPKQQRHVIQTLLPSHPLLSLHFLWYQQTERWNTIESTGEFL